MGWLFHPLFCPEFHERQRKMGPRHSRYLKHAEGPFRSVTACGLNPFRSLEYYPIRSHAGQPSTRITAANP